MNLIEKADHEIRQNSERVRALDAAAANTDPTPADYKRERELRGTQVQVAAMLGVHPITIAKRETGATDGPITREAWLALTSLPVKVDS